MSTALPESVDAAVQPDEELVELPLDDDPLLVLVPLAVPLDDAPDDPLDDPPADPPEDPLDAVAPLLPPPASAPPDPSGFSLAPPCDDVPQAQTKSAIKPRGANLDPSLGPMSDLTFLLSMPSYRQP